MRHKAICLLLVSTLLATGCGRWFGGGSGMTSHLKGQQVAADYDIGDSAEVKRRQALQTLLGRSVQRLQNGDLDTAEKEARAALKLDANSSDAVTMLAVIEDRRGRREQAGQHYKRAAELAPRQGDVQNNYGAWLCANGHAAESLVWFDRALRAPGYPTPATARANAGNCALSTGQTERAERDLRQALAQEPGNATALGALAELEFRRGNYLQARAFVERRLAAARATASVLKLASQIEENLGDKAAASRYVRQLRAEFPDASDVNTGGSAGS